MSANHLPAASEVRAAQRHLRTADQRWAALLARVGPYRPSLTPDPFIALVGSIVHQQVSMSAGAVIYRRLKALCPRGRLCPAALLSQDEAALRTAGLSRQKASYLRNIAEFFARGRARRARLRRAPDEEVIEQVTQIKGVGRWTAEMLLIFCLHRPDVWPVDDLGLRKAGQRFLGLAEMPTPKALQELGEPWRPYRTYATWYLWRSLELPVAPAITH
jgi:DNA-3-methyladenine glycosylase II